VLAPSPIRNWPREDPSFTIKNVNVSAVWPGATSAEMQGQVADRIEKKLQELPGIDKILTYAKPASSPFPSSSRFHARRTFRCSFSSCARRWPT